MKKLINLIILFLIFKCAAIAQKNLKVITIDVTRNDRLNISQIAESVTPIPLHINDIDEPVVNKVIITPDYLYVRISDRNNPSARKRNCQLRRDGTVNGEVGMKDTEMSEFIPSMNLFYSENTHELVIVYKDYLAIFDENGKFKRKIDNINAKEYYYVSDNQYWHMEIKIDFDNNKALYQLTATNLTTLNIDTIYSYTHIMADGEKIFHGSNFSVANNTLYFTNNYENEVIGIDSNKAISQLFKFNIKNVKENPTGSFVRPSRYVSNEFIYFGYNNGPGQLYLYLYNITTEESFNVRVRINANNKLLSIRDDVLGTNYFDLKETNLGNYAYDVKQGYEVAGNIDGVRNELDPVIFLIKLK